ncbi:MAG TPA: CCA tRNA nucleotidyltransferase, partial [Nitrososphaeraceae archaeon]|nr:CCA tRNA nucleotidyltransferase [Nitrososphaeraceae archaeon]
MNKNINNRKIDYELNEAKIDNIISTILEFIQPSAKDIEKVKSIEKKIIEDIKSYKIPQIVDIQTGGSFAKDTNLKNDMDIDIFVLIDKNVGEVDFERIALDVGFKALKNYNPITRYSEHPYVEGVVNIDKKNSERIRLNIVPCYDVEKGKWQSAADRSQYHTTYMQKMLKPYQKNQIRILKSFLKGVGIYGAELSISGFSGYVTEVLVLKFGNFKNVIKYIASLTKENEIIAIENDNNEIKNKEFESPIIIIDPVDPNRNLGKAISSESLSKFIYAARAFLTNPSINFFKIERGEKEAKNKEIVLGNIDNLLPNILVLEFSFRFRSPDIIWGQLKKLTKSIDMSFNENEFIAIKSGC